MTPLATNQRVLTWIGISPVNEMANKRDRILANVSPIVFIAVLVGAIIGSAVYFVKNVSVDMTSSLFAFFTFSALIATVYTFLTALVIRHKILVIFVKLSDFYKACMYSFGHFLNQSQINFQVETILISKAKYFFQKYRCQW